MTILERINYISKISLDFDFNNYLKENNKEIVVFKIDTLNKKYVIKEGRDFDKILEQANLKYVDSKAGYLVNIKLHLKTDVDSDLMLLSDIVLNSNPIDLDTIIIHELVHMLIDSEQSHLMTLSEDSEIMGKKIYKITDYCDESCTRHTEDFCINLAQACINYNRMTKNFESDLITIKSAMRFDVFE
jgi:hypothetical protein